MLTSVSRTHRFLSRPVPVLVLLVCAGCGGAGVETAAPVDPEQAQRTLETVLDAWQQGEPPEALRDRRPTIVVQDMDWKAGQILVAYEPAGPPSAVDANLICPVRLVLRDGQGRQTEKTVTYIVGTDPVLTVFRQMF